MEAKKIENVELEITTNGEWVRVLDTEEGWLKLTDIRFAYIKQDQLIALCQPDINTLQAWIIALGDKDFLKKELDELLSMSEFDGLEND